MILARLGCPVSTQPEEPLSVFSRRVARVAVDDANARQAGRDADADEVGLFCIRIH